MKQNGSINLFQYWNRLRNGRPAPKRTEIEPADIKSLLADTFILEKDTRGEAVFRLAGTRLCAVYGRELKGFSFPSLWRASDQRLIAKLAHGVFQSKSVVVMAFEGHSRNGRSTSFELLLLPLDGGVESPRSLGVISAAGRPFWLGADPVVDAVLESVRVVDPDLEPMYLKNRPAVTVPSLEPSYGALSGSEPSLGSARRIRHLLVLPGGRNE
ncbi:PAS domain-containing protein [Allomesorhizobium camelthorni]|uniref:PAS domain-containing protein n=1 Tax=Allomesorhizobium camelthorni TaxID=475069 RepID=A0A6G4WCY0_9HYPH|nr:PAS domain-containing protein [Mesorhizobium camelthorni]NGO52655.1 PAS domain-containing protein [Mesorhizobium camelthorni]